MLRMMLPCLLLCSISVTGCEATGGGGGGGGSAGDDRDMGRGGEGEGEGEGEGGCFVEGFDPGYAYAFDTCTGRDLCVDGFCEPAFSRRYEIFVLAVEVPDRKSNGDCWDGACGAPDPFTNTYLDDEFVGGTPTRSDRFNAEWSATGSGFVGEGTVFAGSTLRIDAYDEDIAADDDIATCTVELDIDTLRRRSIICTNDDETLVIRAAIVP
ncbi:MAG: hypothetical protein H6701_12335 [Myxococcales bacterium]|nr:hypothetical protein [Myxococcales bacterium]